jgi:hypothetical protein
MEADRHLLITAKLRAVPPPSAAAAAKDEATSEKP